MGGNRYPKRRKIDRLTAPDVTASENACYYAMAPFDRVATEMDLKWGIDRLPSLVPSEMATKYGKALGHLNECLELADPEKTRAAAENCIKGMRAMNDAAEMAGHAPAAGEYIEGMHEGDGKAFRFAILKDANQWQAAKAARPELQFYTMAEVAIALKHYADRYPIGEVKDLFPNARITKITEPPPKLQRTATEIELDDEIPF